MDWLRFRFCAIIWILSVSKSNSLMNKTETACVKGQAIPPPDECNNCICYEGEIHCTHLMCSPRNGTGRVQECVRDEDIPRPDECNHCVCKRGRVACTNLFCISDPECVDQKSYSAQDECNVCVCMNGVLTCTNNFCGDDKALEGPNLPSNAYDSCVEGQPMDVTPCLECQCVNGVKKCINTCLANITMEYRLQEPECRSGEHIPKPDNCNNCICFEGTIHCTHIPCRTDTRIGPECVDDIVYHPDECNECYCFEGRLECSDLVCIRGSKCVEGEQIPKPDACNVCKCFEGHILCTDYQCPAAIPIYTNKPEIRPIEEEPQHECKEGDVIPPPLPPNDCNTCVCQDHKIVCTTKSCSTMMPQINSRFQEQSDHKNINVYDKQISVDPFINMISKNYDKTPTKLVHTHAYNGFHQEIKVHSKHLPQDTSKLLKALATSLDNPALASIGDQIKTSALDTNHNKHPSKISFGYQGSQNKLSPVTLDQVNEKPKQSFEPPEIDLTHSSKLVTSGSLSNETIVLIPDDDSSDMTDPNAVIPMKNQHETIWKSVSSPPPQIYKNIHQITPYSSEEEKLQEYYYDHPPTMITSIDQYKAMPSKFGRPGLHNIFPTSPTRNTIEHSYVSQEDAQPKLVPFGIDPTQDRPVPQKTNSKTLYNLNINSPHPTIKSSHEIFPIATSDDSLQSRFKPNPALYYPNQFTPRFLEIIPHQNRYSQNPPKFQINPLNSKSANQYLPRHVDKGKPFNNQFKANPESKNYDINQPDQEKRISAPDYPVNQNKLSNTKLSPFEPNPALYNTHHSDNMPNQGLLKPHSTISYVDQYSLTPTDITPDHKHIHTSHNKGKHNKTHHHETHSTVTFISEYDSSESSDQDDQDLNIFQNDQQPSKLDLLMIKVNKYLYPSLNPKDIHSKLAQQFPTIYYSYPLGKHPTISDIEIGSRPDNQFEKNSMIYPNSPSNATFNNNDANSNLHYPHPTLPTYSVIQNYPHSPIPQYPKMNQITQLPKIQFGQVQNQNIPGDFSNRGSVLQNFKSIEDPIYSKTKNKIPPYSQFQPPSFHHFLEVYKAPEFFDGPQSTPYSVVDLKKPKLFHLPKSQYKPNSNLDETSILNNRGSAPDAINHKDNKFKTPKPTIDPTQHQHILGIFDNRGLVDKLQYPYNFLSNEPRLKDYLHLAPQSKFKPPHDQFGSTTNNNKPSLPTLNPFQKQHSPELSDNRGSRDDPKYAFNAVVNQANPKDYLHVTPQPQLNPVQNQNTLGFGDDQRPAEGLQYPSKSAEDPPILNFNPQLSPHPQLNSSNNQHTPGIIDNQPTDDFQYSANTVGNSAHPKDNLHIPPQSQFDPSNKNLQPGVFDDRGSADGIQYPSSMGIYPTNLNPTNHDIHKTYDTTRPTLNPLNNQHVSGIFDDRGSADGFRYPSYIAEGPKHPNTNVYGPSDLPQTTFKPSNNQYIPGDIDNKPTGDFPYSVNSARPKDNLHIPPQSQFDPSNKYLQPGVLDDRGSADGFQYPSISAINPTVPSLYIHKTHETPRPTINLNNQHVPGIFDDRGSTDGFQYPSHFAEYSKHPIGDIHEPYDLLQPTLNPSHKPHIPGVIDNQPSADFQYSANSVGNSAYPKDNMHIPPQSQYDPSHKHLQPGIFDDRGSADGIQYPSYPTINPTNPNLDIYKSYDKLWPTLNPLNNQHIPGIFDDRGSADAFQYPSHIAEGPKQPSTDKHGSHYLPQPTWHPFQNQHAPEVTEPTNDIQYSVNPAHPKDNLHLPPQSQFELPRNHHQPGVLDERRPAEGIQYPSNVSENHGPYHMLQPTLNPSHNQYIPGATNTDIKDNIPLLPHSTHFEPPNNHLQPGVFDDSGVTDGNEYPSNPNPTNSDLDLYKTHDTTRPTSNPSANQYIPGMIDNQPTDDFQYPANPAANSAHPKDNMHILPQSQVLPGIFNDKGSADGFQYPFQSPLDLTNANSKTHKNPELQFNPSQNQGVLDERGSADGFQYPTSTEDYSYLEVVPFMIPTQPPFIPTQPSFKSPQSHLKPSQNQHLPEGFDERGSSDGFQYIASSAEDVKDSNKNRYDTTKDQHLPWTDNGVEFPSDYNYKSSDEDPQSNTHTKLIPDPENPLRPWTKLDHDQYKPSSFDSLLNGVHNIPWHLPGNHIKISDGYTSIPSQMGHEIPKSKDTKNDSNIFYQTNQGFSTPTTDSIDFDNNYQNTLHPKIEPQERFSAFKNFKVPNKFYPILIKTVKKLIQQPTNSGEDESYETPLEKALSFLPYLIPEVVKLFKKKPVEYDESSEESHEITNRNPWGTSKPKQKITPSDLNRIVDWVKDNYINMVPIIDNVAKNNNHPLDQLFIESDDPSDLFNVLFNLAPSQMQPIMGQSAPRKERLSKTKEDLMINSKGQQVETTTNKPRTTTKSYVQETRYSAAPKPEDNRYQPSQVRYPDVHIILHQPDADDDMVIPPYTMENNAQAFEFSSEELGASLHPKILNPRVKYRQKDQKEECGEGTEWTSKCHSCTCHTGQAICIKMPECELRAFGQPMTCKPYSTFKMGDCYSCVCNGDGFAECDATDCKQQLHNRDKEGGSTELSLPVYHKFYDEKQTSDLIKYYNFYKKLPKDCPSSTIYPTCEPRTTWVSSCYKCQCNENSQHECSRIQDCELDIKAYDKPGRCKPNTKFYPKTTNMPCVECTCDDEGNPYCPTVDYKRH